MQVLDGKVEDLNKCTHSSITGMKAVLRLIRDLAKNAWAKDRLKHDDDKSINIIIIRLKNILRRL